MGDLSVPVHGNVAELGSKDPTESKTLRKRYEAEFYNRWRELKGLVNQRIIQNDSLQLNASSLSRKAKQKIEEFIDWFREKARSLFGLDKSKTINQRPGSQQNQEYNITPWIAGFALLAYTKGIEVADTYFEAKIVSRPEFATKNQMPFVERYGLMASRHQSEVEGLVDRVVRKVRRVVSDGIQSTLSRRAIASNINNVIDDDGILNGRRIANTETIRTINDAALTVYDKAGVEGVTAKVEYLTRQDDRVCPKCKKLHGRVYDIDEAYGLLPQHPLCRCFLLPHKPN